MKERSDDYTDMRLTLEEAKELIDLKILSNDEYRIGDISIYLKENSLNIKIPKTSSLVTHGEMIVETHHKFYLNIEDQMFFLENNDGNLAISKRVKNK